MADYSTDEITKSQVLTGGDSDELSQDTKLSGTFFKRIRDMRRHPTIALARQLAVAPLLAAEWSIEEKEGAPPDAKAFIQKQIEPLRIHLLRTSLFGCCDFGFSPYEKVFKVGEQSGLIEIKKVKPLLQDITKVIVDKANGSFLGLKQEDITLELPQALLVNIDVEGTYWYGEPTMKAADLPFEWWNICNNANVRYDKKIAGAHWIIHYPPGNSVLNGTKIANDKVAQSLLTALESSGSIAVPRKVEEFVDDLNKEAKAWEIELLSAYPTSNVAFVERLKYLDALMARALGMPERAILEGQFGTKAEAEAHADFAITNMELRHKIIVQQYNWHLVNQLLRVNYGPEAENTVLIAVAPLTDLTLQYLRATYTKFLDNQEGFGQEFDNVDTEAMRDKLGIPSKKPEDVPTADTTGANNALQQQAANVPGLLSFVNAMKG